MLAERVAAQSNDVPLLHHIRVLVSAQHISLREGERERERERGGGGEGEREIERERERRN